MTAPVRRGSAALTAALVTLAASLTPVFAQDVPTADELVARSKLAAGSERRPETEREAWAVRIAGLDGTVETVRRSADSLTTTGAASIRRCTRRSN